MGKQLYLVRIEDVPEAPVYRKSFVRYHFGNILIYDHRREILETKGKRPLFEERFKKPAMLQVVDRRGYVFFNIFEPEAVAINDDVMVLVAASDRDGNAKVTTHPISSIRVNVDCTFFETHKLTMDTFIFFRQKVY